MRLPWDSVCNMFAVGDKGATRWLAWLQAEREVARKMAVLVGQWQDAAVVVSRPTSAHYRRRGVVASVEAEALLVQLHPSETDDDNKGGGAGEAEPIRFRFGDVVLVDGPSQGGGGQRWSSPVRRAQRRSVGAAASPAMMMTSQSQGTGKGPNVLSDSPAPLLLRKAKAAQATLPLSGRPLKNLLMADTTARQKFGGGDHAHPDARSEQPQGMLEWSSKQVLAWLRETAEMPQYTEGFAAEEVDGETLLFLCVTGSIDRCLSIAQEQQGLDGTG